MIRTVDANHAALRAAGFRPGAPSRDTASDDELACGLAFCPACHTQGLTYHPYVRRDRRSLAYRFLAVCPACCNAEEW
jgi:hypothetical protein